MENIPIRSRALKCRPSSRQLQGRTLKSQLQLQTGIFIYSLSEYTMYSYPEKSIYVYKK